MNNRDFIHSTGTAEAQADMVEYQTAFEAGRAAERKEGGVWDRAYESGRASILTELREIRTHGLVPKDTIEVILALLEKAK